MVSPTGGWPGGKQRRFSPKEYYDVMSNKGPLAPVEGLRKVSDAGFIDTRSPQGAITDALSWLLFPALGKAAKGIKAAYKSRKVAKKAAKFKKSAKPLLDKYPTPQGQLREGRRPGRTPGGMGPSSSRRTRQHRPDTSRTGRSGRSRIARDPETVRQAREKAARLKRKAYRDRARRGRDD